MNVSENRIPFDLLTEAEQAELKAAAKVTRGVGGEVAP